MSEVIFNNDEIKDEVIWCKDCIYYTPTTRTCIALKIEDVPSSFFCAYGNNGRMVE